MKKSRQDKIIKYIETKRAEGKLDMEAMLSIIKKVDKKAREETIETIKENITRGCF